MKECYKIIPNIIIYTTILKGYCECGNINKANNLLFNEIKSFYIFFERNNYRKIHGLQVCLVLWSCVCFWELPRLKFERVESKGISSICHVFASLNTNFVSLRPWQGAHGFSSRSNCKLGRTFTTQGFCAGTTFTPWIFFFHSLFPRNTFTKIPYHLFL